MYENFSLIFLSDITNITSQLTLVEANCSIIESKLQQDAIVSSEKCEPQLHTKVFFRRKLYSKQFTGLHLHCELCCFTTAVIPLSIGLSKALAICRFEQIYANPLSELFYVLEKFTSFSQQRYASCAHKHKPSPFYKISWYYQHTNTMISLISFNETIKLSFGQNK